MTRDRYLAFDYLRFVSIIGVVIIHVTAPFMVDLIKAGKMSSPDFGWLVVLNQGARYCVPAFFLAAGFFTSHGRSTYFSKPGEAKAYIVKRFIRLLLPYATWSLIFYILPAIISGKLSIFSTTKAIILGSTIEGGYFIIVLAQLTILGPMLLNRIKDRHYLYGFLIILSLAISELYFLIAGYGQWPLSRWARAGLSYFMSTFLPWFAFYVSGLLLGIRYDSGLKKIKINRSLLLAGLFVFWGLSMVEFYKTYEMSQSLSLAASFLKPSSIAYAYLVCAMVLTKPKFEFEKAWRGIASGSYGIYLIHGGILPVLFSIGLIRHT